MDLPTGVGWRGFHGGYDLLYDMDEIALLGLNRVNLASEQKHSTLNSHVSILQMSRTQL